MSQSKLRFSIEESVWLKKGQEVAEVLSMSLDPDIRITEEAGQVYIKGALILNGRYRAENQDQNAGDPELNPLAESVSYRSLTQLSVAEDGVTDLVHRFPVDITIPSYRVEDANEVKVEVESFEYELPNSTCFELSASICIYGIKDEKQRQESPAYDSPKEEIRSVAAEERSAQKEEKQDIFTPFQFEARQSGGVPSQPQPNEFLARFNENNAEVRDEKKAAFEFKPHFEALDDRTMEATFDSLKAIAFSSEDTRHSDPPSIDEPEAHYEEDHEVYGEVEASDQNDYSEAYDHEEEEAYESYQAQQTPDYEAQTYQDQPNSYQSQSPYQDTNRPYSYNPYQQQQAYQQQANHYANYQYQQNHSERPSYSNEYEYGEQSYEAEQEYEDSSYQQSAEEHDASYEYEDNSYAETEPESQPVAEQVERDEPRDENALYLTKMLSAKEDRFSKMRMYILQRGDSLEHICERYDISLNTLMRMNRLQQGEVSEGQIIYIPVSSR
ncbi:LysM peptidoglycan-binding domain-containing protein [Fictibacillus sp. b24]|uniref:LysM peptidoglycan-binding domain-containing protein n=1 Tax=Fictibacillus sp. b24 TaxID=3055863 RepID=UPI0025A24762|nr:LysM peptidoglycan-binding domain-containing protein [Fictibacillus sp. b24]MDM5315695.1 LysM peptidoglycan-binding domain-containing protein [Fictibacillus sp. b24]